MTKATFPSWVPRFIIATAILSLISLYFRFGVESRNRAVGVVADMDSIQELAAAQGTTMDFALKGLKAKGLTGVVLSEETVGDLVSAGQVAFAPPAEDGSIFIGGVAGAAERINTGLQVRYPKAKVTLQEPPPDSVVQGKGVSVSGLTSQLIRRAAVGLNPGEAQLAKEHGLQIVTRNSNPAGAGESTVRETLQWAKELGATVFLPQGDQVLGRRDNLKVLRETLEQLGMLYATPEFAKIGGDANIVEADPGLVVRLHSAQSQELDKLSIQEAVIRYVRAAQERNQRMLLVRPVSLSSAEPLSDFAKFIEKIKVGLEDSGFKLGNPHPFDDTSSTPLKILFVLIGIAAAPLIYWVAATFITAAGPQMLGALLLLLLAIACGFSNDARQFMALFAAIAFPTGAFLMLDARKGTNWMVEYALMSAVSLTGGLCVAALLNGLPYFVRADQFMGVKAAHFAPIILVGLYLFWRYHNAKETLRSPVSWLTAGTGLVVLVGLVLMSTRTGNDNPAAVSGLELRLRDLLDTILMVRPRTKEFLIGHPLLVLGIALFIASQLNEAVRQKWGGWVTLLLMGGAIGQTSIVNTMCHLHTPLSLSLARIVVGFVAGGIIGAGLWALVQRMQPKEES